MLVTSDACYILSLLFQGLLPLRGGVVGYVMFVHVCEWHTGPVGDRAFGFVSSPPLTVRDTCNVKGAHIF